MPGVISLFVKKEEKNMSDGMACLANDRYCDSRAVRVHPLETSMSSPGVWPIPIPRQSANLIRDGVDGDGGRLWSDCVA